MWSENVYGIWKVLCVIVDHFVGLPIPPPFCFITSETPVDKFHISKQSIVSLKRIQIKDDRSLFSSMNRKRTFLPLVPNFFFSTWIIQVFYNFM